MYIYQANILIEGEDENAVENQVDDLLHSFCAENAKAHYVSSLIRSINGKNWGRCHKCGEWVSKHNEQDYVTCFSNGALIEGKWFCDLCLPHNHPDSF